MKVFFEFIAVPEKGGLVVKFALIRFKDTETLTFFADGDGTVSDLEETASFFSPDGKGDSKIELPFVQVIFFCEFNFFLTDGAYHQAAEAVPAAVVPFFSVEDGREELLQDGTLAAEGFNRSSCAEMGMRGAAPAIADDQTGAEIAPGAGGILTWALGADMSVAGDGNGVIREGHLFLLFLFGVGGDTGKISPAGDVAQTDVVLFGNAAG